MSSKTANWMIASGIVMGFLGLCILPAAFGKEMDSVVFGVGCALFSLGGLIVAGGIYAKALQLKGNTTPVAAAVPRAVRGGCELCGTETPVVECKAHQLQLCGNCLGQHYDFRSCNFIPSARKSNAKAGKSMAAARGRGL